MLCIKDLDILLLVFYLFCFRLCRLKWIFVILVSFTRKFVYHLIILLLSFIPFMLIHSNLWGPCCIDSYDGFKYFVLFIDDYSRTTWIFSWSTRMKFILFSRIFVSCWWFSLIVKSRFFIRIIGLNLQRVLFFPFFPMKALFIKLVVFFGDYKIFHGSNECAGEILVRRSCNICVLDK